MLIKYVVTSFVLPDKYYLLFNWHMIYFQKNLPNDLTYCIQNILLKSYTNIYFHIMCIQYILQLI